MNNKEKLEEATILALEGKLDLFKQFLDKYKFTKNLALKFENNKFYESKNNNWTIMNYPPKIVRNVDKYKIAANHFTVNVPYTTYYIIDDNDVYSGYENYSYLSGNLKDLVIDLNKVVDGTFGDENVKSKNDFDPLSDLV